MKTMKASTTAVQQGYRQLWRKLRIENVVTDFDDDEDDDENDNANDVDDKRVTTD